MVHPQRSRECGRTDCREQGEAKFNPEVEVNKAEVPLTLVIFECVDVSVFDLLDQRSYEMFTSIDVYDAATDSAPFAFGYRSTGKAGLNQSYVEPAATIFLENPTRFKVSFGHGIAGGKYTLLNVPEGKGQGLGYYVGYEQLADFEDKDRGGALKEPWGLFEKLAKENLVEVEGERGRGRRCARLAEGEVLTYRPARTADWTGFELLRIRCHNPSMAMAKVEVSVKTASRPEAATRAAPLGHGVNLVTLKLSDFARASGEGAVILSAGALAEMSKVTGLQIKVASARAGEAVFIDDVILESPRVVTHTPYRMARDIHRLDDFRVKNLKKHSVSNDKVDDLHEKASLALADAEDAFKGRKYDRFIKASRNAWGFEGRAYPSVQGTTIDILSGVLFYLFLLLPFSYFAERLIFAFGDINKQILGFFGIFLAIFIILWNVHPAFGVTNAAPIILLSFVTLALSITACSSGPAPPSSRT